MPYKSKDKEKQSQKAYREKNREKAKAYAKEYHIKNPPPPEMVRERKLKHKYGITTVEYDSLFHQQEGNCAICGKHQLEFSKRLSVDHNHTTQQVRGLLCQNCNTALGLLEENPDTIQRMILYIGRYS